MTHLVQFPARIITRLVDSTGTAGPVDSGRLRDITGIENLPPLPSHPVWPWVVAGAVLGLIVLGFIWTRRRGLAAAPPEPDPKAKALEELARWSARLPLPDEDKGEFYPALSHTLRRYLERQLALVASHQTTPEFLQTLKGHGRLTADQHEAVKTVLESCDLARFARVPFSADDDRRLVDTAHRLVGQTLPVAENSPLPDNR